MRIINLIRRGDPFPGSAFQTPLYRIPAVTIAGNRILVAFDVRADWRDLPADFDIALVSSDDEGKSWSSPMVLRRHEPGHGFGDAALTYDPFMDRVFCWSVGSMGESYFSAVAGGAGLELWLSVSDDHGQTWSHRDLSELRPDGVAGMFTASGTGTILPDGRLVQPFVARINDEDYAVCATSSDHGQTWTLGTPLGPGCDESKVIALSNGEVLLHARSAPRRRSARSKDAGANFTAPRVEEALVDPGCNGGLVRIGDVFLASMCSSPVERCRLSVHVSTDEGESWSEPIVVDEGAAAYSALAALDENRVVLVWEADDYEAILAAVISLDELGVHREDGVTYWDSTRVTLSPRRGLGSAKPPIVNTTC